MDLTGLCPILFARGRVRGEVRDEGKGEAHWLDNGPLIPTLKIEGMITEEFISRDASIVGVSTIGLT